MKWLLVVLGAAAVGLFLTELPAIRRYIKIEMM